MSRRLCTICGVLTSGGSRCAQHPRTSRTGSGRAVHTSPRWSALSKRSIARHVGQYGYTCPGDGADHAPHPTTDLTLDHIIPLADGGAPFDPANTRVLCRSANSAGGARLVNDRRAGRAAPRAEPVPDERAAIRRRYLG